MYKFVYIVLKLPIGTLETLTALEFSWLLDGYYDNQREELELLNYTVKVAVASAHSGKDIKLFKDNKDSEKKQIRQYDSKEQKQKDLNNLIDSI